MDHEIRTFQTNQGAFIFQITMEVFPGMTGYAYLVLVDRYRVLVDAGSGFGKSHEHLEHGLRVVGDLTGKSKPFSLADLTHILITHGHIDHFGGLHTIRPLTEAKIGVHELDRRILSNYEERSSITARRLGEFLIEAGCSPEHRSRLISMYRMTKSLFSSVPVDFTYEAIGMHLGPFKMLHVPGHSAGHVVIRLHDVLFGGDHILSDITPHQAPEHLTLFTGIDHYLKSLEAVKSWSAGIRLVLGGHERPITDLRARLKEIRQMHENRLNQVLDLLKEPKTIHQVSIALFGEVNGYNELLAIEEAGAHVEYLYQRGLLEIANLMEMENSQVPVAIHYRCAECD